MRTCSPRASSPPSLRSAISWARREGRPTSTPSPAAWQRASGWRPAALTQPPTPTALPFTSHLQLTDVPTIGRPYAVGTSPGKRFVALFPVKPYPWSVSYTHLRAHETVLDLVC